MIGHEGDPMHPADAARGLAATLPNAELVLYPDPSAMLRDVVALTRRVAEFVAG